MENIEAIALNDLIPILKVLKPSEKLYLIQFLASDLSQNHSSILVPNQDYPVWTPLEAYEASDILNNLLNEPEPMYEQHTPLPVHTERKCHWHDGICPQQDWHSLGRNRTTYP